MPGEIDRFTDKHAPEVPSLEATLRIIRDIDPDSFRRIGRDVWGTGQSDGADLLGRAIDGCVEGLENAAIQAAAWTGEDRNAYTERIRKMSQAVNEMRKPCHDVGQALVEIAEGFEFKIQDLVNNALSAIGFVVGAIALVVGLVLDFTGPGAIIGLILNILGILVGMAAWWYSQRVKAEEQIAVCNEASATATKTIESLGKIQP